MSKKEINKMPEEIIRYCNWCGRKIVFARKKINIYDRDTGKPVYHFIYICPMRRRLMLWHDRTLFKLNTKGKLEEMYFE